MQAVKSVLVVFLWIFQQHNLSASKFPLFPVDICPRNETEDKEASERLNCSYGRDETRNEYHCVPLSNFTQIVEFCYPKTSGLIGKGLCMVLSGNTLDARECYQFLDGCPDIVYTSEMMYQFPACTLINTESKCYQADPSCPSLRQPSSTTSHNITTHGDTPMNTGVGTTFIVIGIYIILGFLFLSTSAYFIFRRRRQKNENDASEEMEILVDGIDEEMERLVDGNDGGNTTVIMEDGTNDIEEYARDHEFKKRFQQYLEEGSVDVCPISQIIIVGENGVGKTTLLYRLQGRSQEEIDQIKSTRGVDCHIEKSGFIVTNGQLKMNKEGKSNLAVPAENLLADTTGLKKEVKITEEDTKEVNIMKEDKEDAKSIKEDKRESEELGEGKARSSTDVRVIKEEDTKRNVKEIIDAEDVLSHTSEKIIEEVSNDDRISPTEGANILQDKTDGKVEEICPSISEETTSFGIDEQHSTDVNTKDNKVAKNPESIGGSADPEKNLAMKLKSIIEEKLKEEQDIRMNLRNKNDAVLNCLDFAGQGAYYASHQTHMRKDAIYIIVFDVSRNLTEGKVFADSITHLCDRPDTSFSCWAQKDFIHYWLNTIRVHGGNCDNIILVGTHEDSKRSDFDFKYKELLTNIRGLLPERRCEVILDLSRNSKEGETKLRHIKEYICKAVSKSERKLVPAKWMKYESVFDMIKSETPVISIGDLLEIIDQTDSDMWDVEIHDMLRYFHENGSILFFNMNRLREIIIIDIQWFVDCFKHIITDHEHAKEDHGVVHKHVQEKWNLFFEKGILIASFYEDLMVTHAATLPKKHREILGSYLQKLGMMFYMENFEISDKEKINAWYVPCVNTEKFEAVTDKYDNTKASPILCFRFEDYLPIDLFGRMVVLCLSSGKWHPFGRSLYREGAHMLYFETEEENQDPLEIYLFTSRRIITVQILNLPTAKLRGEGVKVEIQNVIQELLANFYACLTDCETGFLCNKNKGYKESSVEHFIQMTPKAACCHTCKNVAAVKNEMEQAHAFWSAFPKQNCVSNEMDPVDVEREWIIACYKAYLEVQQKILLDFNAEEDMGFGTFFISLLKKVDTGTTTREDSRFIYQETKMEKLDSFVDIGVKLKHLSKNLHTSDRDKEQTKREIREVACNLKKVSLAFDEKDRHLRRNFFFSWTDIVKDIQHESIHSIPEISLIIPNLEFGDEVKLEASVDIDVSYFIWLKKKDSNNRLEILQQNGEPNSDQMRNDLYEFNHFSVEDEGQYQLIVLTKHTVGRKTFHLQAERSLHADCDDGSQSEDRPRTAGTNDQKIFSSSTVVAAMDIGTAFSGYAYSLGNASVIESTWNSSNISSKKTPSIVLLKPNKTFHAFGYDAENEYASLTEDNEHEGWLYFRSFKMAVQNKCLRQTMTIKDVNGKEMPVMTIFTMVIKYLRSHLLERLTKSGTSPNKNSIWVVTVPSTWDESAKQLMKEAASEAGISIEHLLLLSEPEATSIYYNASMDEMLNREGRAETYLIEPGTLYMVLDLGGTADVTVLEAQPYNKFRKVHHDNGPWGGTAVDDAFYQFLVEVFGNEVLMMFKDKYKLDNIDLFYDFERTKRNFRPDFSNQKHVRILTS